MASLFQAVIVLVVLLRISHLGRTVQNTIKIIQPSLFPNVSPFIKFSNYKDPPVLLPNKLKKQLVWGGSVPLVNTIIKNTGLKLINITEYERQNKSRVSTTAPLWMGTFKTRIRQSERPEKLITREYQKYNLIPGGEELCRKSNMWFNFQKFMKKFGAAEVPFLIESYSFPGELLQFLHRLEHQTYCDGNRDKNPWIFKSSAGSDSRGMFMFYDWKISRMRKKGIIQTLLGDGCAYTINGFHLRYRRYVLVTSFHPLRIYLYDKGETILGKDYRWQPTSSYMEDKELFELLTAGGFDVEILKNKIEDAIIKSMLVVEHKISTAANILKNSYNAYQLWSADFILDVNLDPKLLEFNRYASLTMLDAVQQNINPSLVTETLNVAGYHFPPTLSKDAKRILLDQLALLNTTMNNDLDSIVFQRQLYSFQEMTNSTKTEYYNSLYAESGYGSRRLYLDKILKKLDIGDVKMLMTAEDELSRTRDYIRVFPTNTTHRYLRYLQSNPYKYMLQDAWESKYGQNRGEGIKILSNFATAKFHLMG